MPGGLGGAGRRGVSQLLSQPRPLGPKVPGDTVWGHSEVSWGQSPRADWHVVL